MLCCASQQWQAATKSQPQTSVQLLCSFIIIIFLCAMMEMWWQVDIISACNSSLQFGRRQGGRIGTTETGSLFFFFLTFALQRFYLTRTALRCSALSHAGYGTGETHQMLPAGSTHLLSWRSTTPLPPQHHYPHMERICLNLDVLHGLFFSALNNWSHRLGSKPINSQTIESSV